MVLGAAQAPASAGGGAGERRRARPARGGAGQGDEWWWYRSSVGPAGQGKVAKAACTSVCLCPVLLSSGIRGKRVTFLQS